MVWVVVHVCRECRGRRACARALKVGSSLVKRFSALENWPPALRSLGAIARLMTGSGTWIGGCHRVEGVGPWRVPGFETQGQGIETEMPQKPFMKTMPQRLRLSVHSLGRAQNAQECATESERRTWMDVMASRVLPSVNVSPDAHSTPNMAMMSPAPASGMSCSSSECMRTRRGTLIFLPLATLTMLSPLRSTPGDFGRWAGGRALHFYTRTVHAISSTPHA